MAVTVDLSVLGLQVYSSDDNFVNYSTDMVIGDKTRTYLLMDAITGNSAATGFQRQLGIIIHTAISNGWGFQLIAHVDYTQPVAYDITGNDGATLSVPATRSNDYQYAIFVIDGK